MVVQYFIIVLFLPSVASNAGLFDLAEYRQVSYDATIGDNFLWFAQDLDLQKVTADNIDDFEKTIVKNIPDETLPNYMFVTSKGGQKFACLLPEVEDLKAAKPSRSSKNPKVYGEALAASFYVEKCITLRERSSWWSYLLCRGRTVEQTHGEQSDEGHKMDDDYYLGGAVEDEVFDSDDVVRRQRQKEHRMRIAASRLPEKERRETMIRTMVDKFSSNEVESTETPIKKKSSSPKKPEIEEEETKEVKMEADEIAEEKNPIKRAAMERLKEIEKNDDLLYDDQEDEDDEKWVKEHRKITQGQDLQDGEADGVLSCPGLLTRDCQRHEIYKTQYRAMFVTNCQLEGEKMAIEKTGKEKRRQRQKSRKSGVQTSSTAPVLDDSDLYTQVKCSSCGTIVAMMDSDEVYHFFNVLAGYIPKSYLLGSLSH
uniref:PRKCSH domain-containing protein n=1 Tax=Caenorhabditis tropicalis TaxID=1561998 RepID=A0A1I7TMD4_9PELO